MLIRQASSDAPDYRGAPRPQSPRWYTRRGDADHLLLPVPPLRERLRRRCSQRGSLHIASGGSAGLATCPPLPRPTPRAALVRSGKAEPDPTPPLPHRHSRGEPACRGLRRHPLRSTTLPDCPPAGLRPLRQRVRHARKPPPRTRRESSATLTSGCSLALDLTRLVTVGADTPVLPAQRAHWIIRKRSDHDSISKIHDHHPLATPARPRVRGNRNLAVPGDLHHVARRHVAPLDSYCMRVTLHHMQAAAQLRPQTHIPPLGIRRYAPPSKRRTRQRTRR